MLKIIATISNYAVAANMGGNVENTSVLIEIPTSSIPPLLKQHLENKEIAKWQTVSLSILHEEI